MDGWGSSDMLPRSPCRTEGLTPRLPWVLWAVSPGQLVLCRTASAEDSHLPLGHDPCPGHPVLTSVDGTLTWNNSEGLPSEQPMESAEAFYCIQLLSLFRPAAFVGSDPGAFSTLHLRDCCDPTCYDLLGRSLSADQNKASG